MREWGVDLGREGLKQDRDPSGLSLIRVEGVLRRGGSRNPRFSEMGVRENLGTERRGGKVAETKGAGRCMIQRD